MRRKRSLLNIEDDTDTADSLVSLLTPLKPVIHGAHQSQEGYRMWAEEAPDIVVLDLELPGGDGMDLLRRRRLDPSLSKAAVVVYTNSEDRDVEAVHLGADEYFHKTRRPEVLLAKVEVLIRNIPVYTEPALRQNIHLDLEDGQKVRVQSRGARQFVTNSDEELRIDVAHYDKLGDVAVGSEDWREATSDLGHRLFEKIFVSHPRVSNEYNRTLARAGRDLHLCFQARSEYVRLPLEFLYDQRTDKEQEFLIRTHPMFRSVAGIRPDTSPICPRFLNQLAQDDRPLRVLLIASNTPPALSGVDTEVAGLKELMQSEFTAAGLKVEFTCLQTKDAWSANVRDMLRDQRHHIFHYAGHSAYDRLHPERSGLYFWENPNSKGQVEVLTSNELGLLLRSSGIQFIFLNSCYGTATGDSSKLRDNFSLGLAHSILRAGVASALGHRFPVSDAGAGFLAWKFYQALADEGCIVTAVHRAREQVMAGRPNSRAWLSPVLLHQSDGPS